MGGFTYGTPSLSYELKGIVFTWRIQAKILYIELDKRKNSLCEIIPVLKYVCHEFKAWLSFKVCSLN